MRTTKSLPDEWRARGMRATEIRTLPGPAPESAAYYECAADLEAASGVPAEPAQATGEVTERHREAASAATGYPKDWVWNDKVARAIATAEQTAFAAGRASGGEWVPVTERLPKDGQLVAFWCRDWVPGATHGLGRFYTDGFAANFFEDETDDEGGYDGRCPKRHQAHTVSHWMPLPPPPEKPTEGGST